MNGADFFNRVKEIVNKERTGHYGEPEDVVGDIAAYWSVYLKQNITLPEPTWPC